MTLAPCHFHLPEGLRLEPLMAGFGRLGKLGSVSSAHLRRTFYDTFDWRLHVAGGLLVEEQEPHRVCTSWRRIDDQRLLGQAMSATPRFAGDFPPGPLREGLASLTEMRALLPVARLQLRVQHAVLLDKARKTVLRLAVEEGQAEPGTPSAGQPLPARLCVEPVRGYRKPYDQACQMLREHYGLEPAGAQLDEVLALSGRQPRDYSGRLDIELQAGMPAGAALRLILGRLLATMERNLPGAIQDLDSEFLHDFRVAVRRTRSLFSQVRGVLPPEVAERFRPGFRWLGQITGATRDLDVYLLKLPGYRQSLPESMQADLQPLHAYLLRHQRQEQRKLARRLGSARCRRLLDEWRSFLDAPASATPWTEAAARPILAIANRRIWKAYRRVVRDGLAIRQDSPATALHELRIDCKKLRYLLEFFQSLYPPDIMHALVKALKSLQDNLGDFHDLEVQAGALRDFGQAMQAEQAALPGETFMAMGVLIDSLHRRQERERRNFAARFARFARPERQRACRELFNPQPGDKEPM